MCSKIFNRVSDFQRFLIDTITKLKFDVAQVVNTKTATNWINENIQNCAQSKRNNTNLILEPFNLHYVLSINSDDVLSQLGKKLVAVNKFRSNLLSFIR